MRIALASWWLGTLIISVGYSANLVAIMSVEVVSYPVNSLEELAMQSHTRIGINKGDAIHSMLKVRGHPKYVGPFFFLIYQGFYKV